MVPNFQGVRPRVAGAELVLSSLTSAPEQPQTFITFALRFAPVVGEGDHDNSGRKLVAQKFSLPTSKSRPPNDRRQSPLKTTLSKTPDSTYLKGKNSDSLGVAADPRPAHSILGSFNKPPCACYFPPHCLYSSADPHINILWGIQEPRLPFYREASTGNN